MKKTLFFSVACWLAAMNASAADWTTLTNIAKGCEVVASSNEREANLITDGNSGTRWQANAQVGQNGKSDWVLVDLGTARNIGIIEIAQEASFAEEFDVYILNEKPQITPYTLPVEEKTYNGNDVSLDGLTPAFSGVNGTDYRFTKVLDKAIEGQYILFYATKKSGTAQTYGTSLYEIYVGEASADFNTLASFKATESISITSGEEGTLRVTPYSLGGDVLDSFEGLEDLKVTVTSGNADDVKITKTENGLYAVTSDVMGYYELTVTATVNGQEQSVKVVLTVNYAWNKNLALHKDFKCSNETTGEKAEYAVDGDSGTRWSSGAVGESNPWFYVDLGGLYNISAIGQRWETAYAKKYAYYVATESGEDGEPDWKELAVVEQDLGGNANQTLSTYVVNDEVKARYVKIEGLELSNNAWGMSFYEFMVDGTVGATLVPTELTLTSGNSVVFLGDTVELTATVKDQYGEDMDAEVAFTVNGESMSGTSFTPQAEGHYTITATVGDCTRSVDITVISGDKKIEVSKAVVTADRGDASLAVDGNKGIAWVANSGIEEADEADREDAGEHTHWIQLNLDYAYTLQAISLTWEGACPADYKVYVGSDADNLIEIFSEEGHAGMATFTEWIAAQADNVKVIKVVTTKNATQYGIKLLEIEAYGRIAEGQNYTRNITSGSYGTLCLPFSARIEGVTAYSIAGKKDGYIVLTEVEGVLEAGTPYLFEATSTELVATYEGASASAKSVNGLVGTLDAITVADGAMLTGKYMVNSNNEIQLCGEGCSLGANRAYIDMAQVPVLEEEINLVNVRRIVVEGGDVTAVETVKAVTEVVDVYTISGVRVRSHVAADKATEGLSAGIYIVNGKKYVVK